MSRFDERLAVVRKERAARTERTQTSPATKPSSQTRSNLTKGTLNGANAGSKFDQRLAEIRKNRKQNIPSYTTPQITSSEKQRDANFWDVTVNSAKRGYYNSLYGEESFNEMMGFDNEKQKYADILADDTYRFEPENGWETAVSGVAEQVGQQFRQWTNPRTLGITGVAGGAAFIGGMVGPQIVVPEEIITIPGAAIAGFKTGNALSSFEIEAGLAYNEMIEQGISPNTAKNIALGVGAANAGLEFLQVDELTDALKVLKKSGAADTVIKRIARELIDRGVDIGKETLQEVGQEAITIGGVQLGSQLERGESAYDMDEVLSRLGETAKTSALTFGLTNTPSGVMHTGQIVSDTKTALRNTPDLQEKITNRLKELGENQKAEQVGELISRYAQGEKLTKKERHLMASSKPSLQVVVEAKNGRFSSVPTQTQTATMVSPENLTSEERHAYRMWVDDVINRRNNIALEKILSTDINGMTREQLHAYREFVEREIYKTSKFASYSQLKSYREKVDAEIAEMERNATLTGEQVLVNDPAANNAVAMESMNLHEYRQMVDAEMKQMGIAPADEYNGQYAQSVVPMVGDVQSDNYGLGETDKKINQESNKNKEYKYRHKKDDESVFSTFDARFHLKNRDVIKPRNIIKEMNKSQIGREMLQFLQENNISVRIYYGPDTPKNLYGYYDFGEITVYADNTKSIKQTASVIIHEATHAKFNKPNTKNQEMECFMNEYKHRGIELTEKVKADIISKIDELYTYLEWE